MNIDFIEKKNRLLRDLGFVEKEILKDGTFSGRFVILGEYHKEQAIIRVIASDDQDNIKKLKREILSVEAVQLDNKIKNCIIAKQLKNGKTDEFVWSIRKYYNYKILADQALDKKGLFHGFDTIDNEFVLQYRPIIKSMVENLEILQSTADYYRTKYNVSDLISEKYLFDFSKFNYKLLARAIPMNFDILKDLYKSQSNFYNYQKNLVPCHGDLSPANLLIDNKKNTIMLDLEYFCFDHSFLDVVYFYLFVWRYPKWQEEIIQKIIITEQDKINFRISVIRIILSCYNEGLEGFKKYDDDLLSQKIPLYRDHIWPKYLQAAGESFEAIVKVKTEE